MGRSVINQPSMRISTHPTSMISESHGIDMGCFDANHCQESLDSSKYIGMQSLNDRVPKPLAGRQNPMAIWGPAFTLPTKRPSLRHLSHNTSEALIPQPRLGSGLLHQGYSGVGGIRTKLQMPVKSSMVLRHGARRLLGQWRAWGWRYPCSTSTNSLTIKSAGSNQGNYRLEASPPTASVSHTSLLPVTLNTQDAFEERNTLISLKFMAWNQSFHQ